MDKSKFLSKVMGLYLLIVSTIMLVNMPQFLFKVDTILRNVPAQFSMGFVVLILGILMVVTHNIWQLHWRVIITILSWLTLFKGIVLLVSPQLIDSISLGLVASQATVYTGAIFDLILGFLLCVAGFRK